MTRLRFAFLFFPKQLNEKPLKLVIPLFSARACRCDKVAPCHHCQNCREVKLNERLSWHHARRVADLSKLGPGLFLLHSAMSHEVVKHFTWKQKGKKGHVLLHSVGALKVLSASANLFSQEHNAPNTLSVRRLSDTRFTSRSRMFPGVVLSLSWLISRLAVDFGRQTLRLESPK